jgi:hypothetical protein
VSEEEQTDSVDRQTALALLAEALQAADEHGRLPPDWFRIGLVSGILAGAGAAALATSCNGPETRRMLSDRGRKLNRRLHRQVQQAQNYVFRLLDRLHGVSDETM